MYKVLEVSPNGKYLPGRISIEPSINNHGRVYYRPQVGYHKSNSLRTVEAKNLNVFDFKFLLQNVQLKK